MNRESGSLLVEVVIALTVIALGVLAFLSSFSTNLRADQESAQQDNAVAALENISEMLRNWSFDDIYANFHLQSLEAPGLEAPEGGPAVVDITCFVDETSLPQEFGPISDLNGGGGLDSANVSGDYQLLPLRLTLDYAASYGRESREIYLVLGP